jgi:hypothetical protein
MAVLRHTGRLLHPAAFAAPQNDKSNSEYGYRKNRE